MKILLNSHIGLLKNTETGYSGAHFFTNLFIEHRNSMYDLHAFIFEKSHSDPSLFKLRIKKDKICKRYVVNAFIPTEEIYNLKNGTANEATKNIYRQIVKTIKDINPDIFFLNGFSALAYLLLAAAHELDIPIISSHHGLWFKEFEAYNNKNNTAVSRTRKEMERDIVRFSRADVFVSRMSLREFSDQITSVPKKQAHLIPVPYNEVYLNRKLASKPKRNVVKIGMVGRWDAVKNHPAFLSLALAAKAQNLNWEFHAVTKIEGQAYNNLVQSYTKAIKVHKPKPPKDLKKFYQDMDLIVVPSLFETYSAVVTEALLQNRPAVIAPKVGWTDTYKVLGYKKWILDFSQPKKVIKKLMSIKDESPSKKLIDHIVSRNSPENIFRQYDKLFEESIMQ